MPPVRPVCFVVMPFRTKETFALPPAPAKVNFDALWEKALRPAIDGLGYQAVRADQDLGALIVKEMLERLYFSDLVIADLSIANGNVYYEVGIRHAACKAGSVLIGADWAKPLFDVDQLRQVRYPLPEGEISDATATAVRDALVKAVPALAQGVSPMFQSLDGYPDDVKTDRATAIRSQLDELANFQSAVQAIGAAPREKQLARALALRDHFGAQRPIPGTVALSILYALRDFAGWPETLAFLDGLPPDLRALPVVREQRALAVSETGSPDEAIGALEELIRTSGPTSEREGLLGGRYKRLYGAAKDDVDKARYLSKAIEHYERGMQLDLNDYFPSCNLPRLYRARGNPGDEDRARAAATVARMACERSKARGSADPYVRPTLLGMAFDSADVEAGERLYQDVVAEGPVKWQLTAMLEDLRRSVSQAKDPQAKIALDGIVQKLAKMIT